MTNKSNLALRPTWNRWLTWLQWCCVLALMSSVLIACVATPRVINHAFGFDALADSPEIEILDYRYGDYAMTRAPDYRSPEGLIRQSLNVNGPFPQGDSLFVKWLIKSSGEVHQDSVSLRERLPADITGNRIHFVIKGPQLFVYLISSERRSADSPPNGPKRYAYRKVITIYPGQPKF